MTGTMVERRPRKPLRTLVDEFGREMGRTGQVGHRSHSLLFVASRGVCVILWVGADTSADWEECGGP